MLNLTNNQLKYLAYGAIGLILTVLLLNIFLTKINNNYNNSTFESFGIMREGMENKNDSSHDPVKKSIEASKIKTENIKKGDLEDIKNLFVLDEIQYIKNKVKNVTNNSTEVEKLLETKDFIDHVTNADKIFHYISYLIDNHDKVKK